ncbi:MAG: hypothetical protein SFX72_12145 [Isosphaeraceae bacterium]|nr:hypothetical protein [Isosphaeraceae bacterium]
MLGCSEELGPERFETTDLSGRVYSLNGPITSGWVEFFPTDGTMGNLTTARIGADGRYVARRVPVGRVAISLVGIPAQMFRTPGGPVPSTVFQLGSSPIRRTVGAGTASSLDLDLSVEAVRFLEERQGRARAAGGTGG